MREILGKAKTVRELLKGVKYSIDYYQREYKWQEKQIRELIVASADLLLSKSASPFSSADDMLGQGICQSRSTCELVL